MSKHVAALNRLAKWRSFLTGWQLGTRSNDDPECQAVRDHREATLILRAEVTALVALLVEKGVFTVEEYCAQVTEEADFLSEGLAQKFPGVRATDEGLSYDLEVINRAGTMRGWKP